MIYDYFSKVHEKLGSISWLVVERSVNFEVVSHSIGIITGIIVFLDNSILDLMELVSEEESDYRFQYMDKDKNLICRWDTAPHHKNIKSFPYHLHTEKGIEESKKMNLIEVLDIVVDKIIHDLRL